MADVSQTLGLLDSLHALKDGLGKGDALARLQALELSRKLQSALEAPGETLIKLTWAEVRSLARTYAVVDVWNSQLIIGSYMLPRIWGFSGFYQKTMKLRNQAKRLEKGPMQNLSSSVRIQPDAGQMTDRSRTNDEAHGSYAQCRRSWT